MTEKSFFKTQKHQQVKAEESVSQQKAALITEAPLQKEYFSYINEKNVYHAAHVLKKIVATKPENLKYACLVVSFVEPLIAEKLLGEFQDELRVEIISEMLSLIQYSKAELDNFDKIFRRLLTEQFGGKYVLSKILEQLDVDQKMALAAILNQKYPENAQLFRSIMILFEDILAIPDQDYSRIFGDIPSEILSTAFCSQPVEQINRLYQILPKGVRNIVQQGIELGSRKYSKSDISKAQQFIIEQSRNMEKDGFIGSILQEDSKKQLL